MQHEPQETTDDEFVPVKSAMRVLQIFDILRVEPEGLTFSDFTMNTGWPRSSLHNLLRTMNDAGYIMMDPVTRRYKIGVRMWEAGQAFRRLEGLAQTASPYLEAVKARVNETVQLAILDGLDTLYVAKVESDHPLKLVSEEGSRLPAHATGLGKVLLSGLPDDELRTRLRNHKLERFTPRTITETDALLRQLDEVRRDGYSTDHGEYTDGVHCIAVPVRNREGALVAAMSVSTPSVRSTEDFLREILSALTEQARNLAQIV